MYTLIYQHIYVNASTYIYACAKMCKYNELQMYEGTFNITIHFKAVLMGSEFVPQCDFYKCD